VKNDLTKVILPQALIWAGTGLLVVLGIRLMCRQSPGYLELPLIFIGLAAINLLWLELIWRGLYKQNRETSTIDDPDVTVRTLQQDKRRAEMVLSEMADGIVVVDADGCIALLNRAAEDFFGVMASRVVGMKIENADLHPELARMAFNCVSENKILASEIRLPGLTQRVLEIRAAPFSEVEHGASALLLIHDLTEVRRHEKNQKEFVSNVSHELRTPITAVRVTAEALLSGAKNDAELVDRFLNNILSESDRLSALIDDLMEIAKRDSGIIRTEKSDVKLAGIIDRACLTIKPQAQQKGVTVTVSVPEGLVGYGDGAQLVQLVQNLIDNAVKYTPEGGSIEVTAAPSGESVSISVRDTGIGIPHGEIDRIFERFYRVDKARSRRLGGTGLGLAIVKDIVDAHSGTIAVDTQLGKGSRFIVTLPPGPADTEIYHTASDHGRI